MYATHIWQLVTAEIEMTQMPGVYLCMTQTTVAYLAKFYSFQLKSAQHSQVWLWVSTFSYGPFYLI